MLNKTQVDLAHYFDSGYDTKERFISYWHQIDEILKLKPKNVLEIGVGNKFVSNYLKSRNIKVITFDIDCALKPDYIGDCTKLPFDNDFFDVVACYECLEHLPFDSAKTALKEIYRVTKRFAAISLPDCSIAYPVYLKIPKWKTFKRLFTITGKQKAHRFDGQHYWKIGAKGYSLKMIISMLRQVGFKMNNTYRIFENPYHRIFMLEKK